jgi:hypothetical protein
MKIIQGSRHTSVGAARSAWTQWAYPRSVIARCGGSPGAWPQSCGGDTDGGLGVLTGQCAGMQVVAEDALAACHRGFPPWPACRGQGLSVGRVFKVLISLVIHFPAEMLGLCGKGQNPAK